MRSCAASLFLRAGLGLSLLLICLSGCAKHRAAPSELHIVSRGPEGVLDDKDVVEIVVGFDRPMIKEEEVGREPAGQPITITPASPGHLKWRDVRTLVFRADGRLTRATQFVVEVAKELRSLDGAMLKGEDEKSRRFEFQTARLRGLELPPAERLFLSQNPTLHLRFSQAVRSQDAAIHCSLRNSNKPTEPPIQLSPVEPSLEPAAAAALRPLQTLQRATRYQLLCDSDLKGIEGTLGMVEPLAQELWTYGDLKASISAPADSSPDGLELRIYFTTPVTLEEVARHLRLSPSHPGITSGTLDNETHTTYKVQLNLKPKTRYSLEVTAGLRDIFGQRLVRPANLILKTLDAKPRIFLNQKVAVVEPRSSFYPLWTRNLTSFQVEAVRLPPEKISSFRGLTDWILDSRRRLFSEYVPPPKPPVQRVGPYGAPLGYVRPPSSWAASGVSGRVQTVTLPPRPNKWQRQDLHPAELVGGAARGLFGITVWSDEAFIPRHLRREMEALINVTDIGLLVKLGKGPGILWAVHMSDGKPVKEVEVEVRTASGHVSFRGKTQADGTLRLPARAVLCAEPEDKAGAAQPTRPKSRGTECNLFFVAREGEDLAVLSDSWSDGVSISNFKLPNHYRGTPSMRGFLQTDRGIYRPGETVHVRGLVRAVRPGERMRPPEERTVEAQIVDARGTEVLKKSLSLSRFGGFSVDLELPRGAPLGDYTVTGRIVSGEEKIDFTDKFMVEEFKPAVFTAKVTLDAKEVLLGQKVQARVEANYLFGGHLSAGRVIYTIRRREHRQTFDSFSAFDFADHDLLAEERRSYDRYDHYDEDGWTSEEAEGGETSLDANGRAVISFVPKNSEGRFRSAQEFIISVSVLDSAQNGARASAVLVAHKRPVYLGMSHLRGMATVGQPLAVEAVAVGIDGKPKALRAELVVSEVRWRCEDWESCTRRTIEFYRRPVELSASGPVKLAIPIARSGEIHVSLRQLSQSGRSVLIATSDSVWAHGGSAAYGDDNGKLTLVTDKPHYRPGDTAQLLLRASSADAYALITCEREGVLDHRVVAYRPGQAVALPVQPIYTPNVYIGAALSRGRIGEEEAQAPRILLDMVEVEVDSASRRLAVQVSQDKPAYRPGETVRARVVVRNAEGHGVVSEVALSAADEGVLQLIAYKTPDPHPTFYAPLGLEVHDLYNYARLLRLSSLKPQEEEDLPPPRDSEGGDFGGMNQRRRKFLSTAFWAPAIVTAADGSAEVSFPAPDNLTAFRLMAVAADEQDRFGSGESRFTVNKPLLLTPALPRFLIAGDRAQVGVEVHNYTDSDGTVEVEMKSQGTGLTGAGRRRLALKQGGAADIRFPVEATAAGQAKVIFSAVLGKERDDVEYVLPIELPIRPEYIPLGEGQSLAGVPVALKWQVPGESAGGSPELLLSFDTSGGLSQLAQGLRYLIEYPHGCLEQTTSKVVPMLALESLAQALDLEVTRGTRIREFIAEGVARIQRFQQYDGGFGLWESSRSEPYLTAFGLYGLMLAQRAGYAVPVQVFERGKEYLKSNIGRREDSTSSGKLGDTAFALYVLAELDQADTGAMDKLFEQRANLPLYGQAWLGLAYHKLDIHPEYQESLRQGLLQAARLQNGQGALLRESENVSAYHFSSDGRSTAVGLLLFLRTAPKDPIIPQLAQGLLSLREEWRWYTTQETMFALTSLAELARQQSQGPEASRLELRTDGESKPLLDLKVPTGAQLVRSLALPLSKPRGVLTLQSYGGKVYYGAALRVLRKLTQVAATSGPFEISRHYGSTSTDSGQPITLKVGDLIDIELQIRTPKERNYVALVDFLPAGLEPINPRLQGQEASDSEQEHAWEWNAIEIHDDRVALFSDRVSHYYPQSIRYQARATTPGQFFLPAATVEEMYDPKNSAHTASGKLVIEPR